MLLFSIYVTKFHRNQSFTRLVLLFDICAVIPQKHTTYFYTDNNYVYSSLFWLVPPSCCSCIPVIDTDMGDLPVNPLVLLGVGSSFAFSGLFYHLYQEKKKELKKLKASALLFKSRRSINAALVLIKSANLNAFFYFNFRKYPFSSQINIWWKYSKHLLRSDFSMWL